MAKKKNAPIQIPKPLTNRYFIFLLLFFAWMVFFDKHDLMTQWKLSDTVKRLEKDKIYYHEKIEEVRADKKDIELNKEKIAREQYFMQKQNEDVFIIVEENKE